MEGYIRNKSPLWRHALKRSVAPGEKIPLDELYDQYGVKHGIKQGNPFVDWLRHIKLRDTDIWEIRYKEDQVDSVEDDQQKKIITKEKDVELNPDKRESQRKETQQSPFVKSAPKVEDVVNWSVRQARELLPKFTDQKTLTYALNIVSQLSNKDTICRMLRKRLSELELTRR